jgi:nucleoside-diphosphate-sugar epimerase
MERARPVLRVVLLGASGFVGRAVLRQLARYSGPKEIHVLIHRTPLTQRVDAVRQFEGSLTELPPGLFPEAPHVVIHCGSKQIDRDRSGFVENLRGIDHLVESVNHYTKAIFYASSCSVYGDGPQRAVTEESALSPQSELARSRAACEARLAGFAAQREIKAVVFRPRFVVGAGDCHFLPGLMKLARSGLQIADGEQRYSVIDADDYAEVMLDMARQVLEGRGPQRAFETFNVGYERAIALREIRAVLAEVTSFGPVRYRVPVSNAVLRLMEWLPSKRLRQLAQRLRLIGYDHYGTIQKLASRLDNNVLRADPADAVRKAARFLTC